MIDAPGDVGLKNGLAPLAIADWRRAINQIYAKVRRTDDPREAWSYWHGARTELFATHEASPLATDKRSQFKAIAVFDYDRAFRFGVHLISTSGEAQHYDLGVDGELSVEPFAKTRGLEEKLGRELTLFWIAGYGGGLFLPFKDQSCGNQSYGGGRYLLDSIKGADLGNEADGKLILDFNFAYNPSCALNENYVCPLSPHENTLSVAILGGEKI